MTDLVVVPRASAHWQRMKSLVLDSVLLPDYAPSPQRAFCKPSLRLSKLSE